MATFTSSDGNYFFVSNGDLSGAVTIGLREPDGGPNYTLAEVPGHVLLEFVAEFVRRERIREVESAPTWELLGIPRASVMR